MRVLGVDILERRYHANQIWAARKLEVPTQVQAAVAARHVWNASSRRTRRLRRAVRWRWTLKVFRRRREWTRSVELIRAI
jgi:hypothetical protein